MASAGIKHLCSHAKKSTARFAVADPTTQQSPQVEHSRSLSRHLASRVSLKARLARQFNLSSGVRPISRICQKSVKGISSCRNIVSRTQAKKRSRRHERVKDVKRRIRCGPGKRPPSTCPSGASESGPTPTKQRRRRLDEESDLMGPITESREAHLKRHGGGRHDCPRCKFYHFGHVWIGAYGSIDSQSGPRRKIVWLAERPVRWGGPWGVGCVLCGQALHRSIASKAQGAACSSAACFDAAEMQCPPKRLGTKWARYEVNTSIRASNICQHQHYDVHKIAVEAFFRPDEPISVSLQASIGDDRLLSGAVPQPADWLRAWRICMDPKSWGAAAKEAGTEHYIAQIRENSCSGYTFRAMVLAMGEVNRQKKRQWMRDATHIFIGFDDKD